jgi:hypothetical protein
MFTAQTSIRAPRHVTTRNGLLALRRELIERIGVTAIVLALLAVTLFAGTIVFLVRSVLTSYEGQQTLLGVTETQNRRNDDQDKQLSSINERLAQIDQKVAGIKPQRCRTIECTCTSAGAFSLGQVR